MTAPHLGPGHAVAGKYTIRALLGFTGEVGTYHAAASNGQEVVIKLHDPALGQRADVMGQLERVRAQVAQLPPSSVVPVIDAGYDVGTSAPFSVTEYLPIPSLSRLVETGPLSPEVVGTIMTGLAQILDTAHAHGLHHLALKPNNIFVGPAPHYQVRITDFGASVVRSTSPTHEAYAQSAPWWAPEQLQPAAVLGPATDVFSAALVAFYALTGRPYWMSCQTSPPDLPAWQLEVMGGRLPVSHRARELGSVVNAILDTVFARALSVNQPDRPRSVLELANALASSGGQLAPGPAGASGSNEVGKTLAFPEMSAAGYPPAGSGDYQPPPAFGNAPQPAGSSPQAVVVPGGDTGGQYTATQPAAGGGPPAQAEQQVTPGLPPFPQPARKKKKSAMLPVIIGVGAATLLGATLIVVLFMTGDSETGPVAVDSSSKPVDDETGEGDTSNNASGSETTAGAGGGEAGSGGKAEGEPEKVAVSITCVPACEELWFDNEKVDDPSATAQLLPGRHTVKAFTKGYYPRTATIELTKGTPFKEEYTLVKVQQTRPRPRPQPCGQFLPCK